MIAAAPPATRNGLPEFVPYAWRRSLTGEQQARLEQRRVLLDREAGYGTSRAKRRAAQSASATPAHAAAAPEPAPEPEPEPTPQAPPARCRVCRYLVTSVGHRVNCGEG